MKFISEIFQDDEGGYSAKRTAFFIFIFIFVVFIIGGTIAAWVAGAIPTAVIAFIQSVLDKLVDLIKWTGGFIAAEKGASAITKMVTPKPPVPSDKDADAAMDQI